MADSLILKGVKDVRKHTGSDLLLRRPKGGGDQWKLKRWWITNEVSTQYCTATVFDVAMGGGTVKLALDTGASSVTRIDFDGTDFKFYGVRDINYGALFTEDFELIEYYVMPRLAGGQVMTVTPADAADRPSAPPEVPEGGRIAQAQSAAEGPKPRKRAKVKVDAD